MPDTSVVPIWLHAALQSLALLASWRLRPNVPRPSSRPFAKACRTAVTGGLNGAWPLGLQRGIEVAPASRAEATMTRTNTLLDLVTAVGEYSRSEAELIATVVYMVNKGHVRLCGTFRGSRFDLDAVAAA